jgi:hypothetical protein
MSATATRRYSVNIDATVTIDGEALAFDYDTTNPAVREVLTRQYAALLNSVAQAKVDLRLQPETFNSGIVTGLLDAAEFLGFSRSVLNADATKRMNEMLGQ